MEKPPVNKLQGKALAEFHLSVKKVELPMFDGGDSVRWIFIADVYFCVQDTIPEMKVNLALLCMEGPMIELRNPKEII